MGCVTNLLLKPIIRPSQADNCRSQRRRNYPSLSVSLVIAEFGSIGGTPESKSMDGRRRGQEPLSPPCG